MAKIKIISLDDTDDIIIQIGDKKLEAMISMALYNLKEGEEYDAELTFYMFGDFKLQLAANERYDITHIENYSYAITGKMIDSETIDVGFPISSEWLADYSYLVGQYVTCKLDRLEVNFL